MNKTDDGWNTKQSWTVTPIPDYNNWKNAFGNLDLGALIQDAGKLGGDVFTKKAATPPADTTGAGAGSGGAGKGATPPAKKSPLPMILVGVAAVLVLGGVAFWLTRPKA